MPLRGQLLCVAAAAMLFGSAVRAAEGETIAELIERLGHESFALRERAGEELAQLGEPALAALEEAKTSQDPEIRWRAAVTIHRIHDRLAVAELAGEWETEHGDWFKIVGDRWSSGTPKHGPFAGPIRFHETVGKATQVELVVDQGPTAGQTVRAILQLIGGKLYYCATYEQRWPQSFGGGQGQVYIFKRAKK